VAEERTHGLGWLSGCRTSCSILITASAAEPHRSRQSFAAARFPGLNPHMRHRQASRQVVGRLEQQSRFRSQ
jgi:hypothetical protein